MSTATAPAKKNAQEKPQDLGPRVYTGQPVMIRTNPAEEVWDFGWAMRDGGDVLTDGIEVFVITGRPHHRSALLHVTNPKWKDHQWVSDVYNNVQLRMNNGGQWKECQAPEVEGLKKEVAAALASTVQGMNEKMFRLEKRLEALESAGTAGGRNPQP